MIRLDRVWHWGNSTRARCLAASDVFCSFLVSYRTLDIIFALGATGPGVGKKAREHRKDLVQDACAPQVSIASVGVAQIASKSAIFAGSLLAGSRTS